MSEPPDTPAPPTPPPTSPPPAVPKTGLALSTALRKLLEERGQQGLTLGYIIDTTEQRAFAILMAFLSVPFLIPMIPGVSVPFGLCICLLGIQLAFGWKHPWLPRRMRNWKLPPRLTEKLLRAIARTFDPLEKLIRPRWFFMQNRIAYIAVGVALAINGILLSLPLPIPGSNAPPAWFALILILGLSEEDGITMMIGLVTTTLITAALVIALSLGIIGIHNTTKKDPPATTPTSLPTTTLPQSTPLTQ